MSQKKLKRNPKRSKNETYETKEKPKPSQKYVSPKSRTSMWMIFIFITVAGIIFIMIVVTFTPKETIVVEEHDVIELDYKIWAMLNNTYDYSNPIIEEYNVQINVTSRYEENATNGLILGFYNELLGKSVNYGKTFEINATVDIDKDGIDDINNNEASGYGFPGDLLFNTTILINYKILDIQKSYNTTVLISIDKELNIYQKK